MTSNTSNSGAQTSSVWKARWALFRKSAAANWALFAENPVGLIGLGIIMFFFLLVIMHPILLNTVWDPNIYNPINGFDPQSPVNPSPPSLRHLLGTAPQGQDILSQLMFSARNEFILAVLAAVVTVTIATTLGAVAAYYGGIVDNIIMRVVDLVIMVPALSILIVISGLFELSIVQLAIVIGIISAFSASTVVIKSQALSIKVKPYIEAARVAGGGDFHIIFRHLLPNLMPIALLYMMFAVTGAIFSEAVLAFLGLLEVDMSWGIMLNTTRTLGYMLDFNTKWYLIFPAGLSITLLSSAFYLVGRALDEIVNPRLRQR